MKRINIQLEDAEYTIIKTVAFIQNKSYAQVIREVLQPMIAANKKLQEKMQLVLEQDDEERLEKIRIANEYSDWNTLKKEQDFE